MNATKEIHYFKHETYSHRNSKFPERTNKDKKRHNRYFNFPLFPTQHNSGKNVETLSIKTLQKQELLRGFHLISSPSVEQNNDTR